MTMIREMTSNHGLDSDGDIVIEAVRRAEEEEVAAVKIIIVIIILNHHIETATKAKTQVRSIASTFCTGPTEDCGSSERYRRINGACNNLDRPQVGAAGRELLRLLPPTYR